MNNQWVWHDLYRDHHGWLVQWLHRHLRCGFDADDLAQDTFVRVMGRDDDIATIEKPRAWLATIAHGLVVDHRRRQSLEQAYAAAVRHLPAARVPSPESRVMLLETLGRIDAMLEGLRPPVRSAFLMSRIEGMTYPQIATRIGVSLSSVEKYMATAFRHCLMVRDTA